jgi:creatinine amidohydrolase
VTDTNASADLLLPWQLRERLAARPVVYIPLGTIEWHCEHLPVGLDALTAHGVCLRAAGRDGGIVLPALHFGTGGGHGNYPWTIMMPGPAEIETQINFTLKRLAEMGAKLAVIFSGHFAGSQLDMIDRIVAAWPKQSPLKVLATSVNRIEAPGFSPDHAGLFETTLLYALHPALVQLDRLPSLAEKPLATDDWSGNRHDPDHPIWGVFGPDPRGFDPHKAQGLLDAIVAGLIAHAQASLPR